MKDDALASLEAHSLDSLGIDLDTVLEITKKAEALRKLLGEDGIYTQRTTGLARGTTKDDPKDCRYVQKALAEAFSKDGYLKLRILVDDIKRLYAR